MSNAKTGMRWAFRLALALMVAMPASLIGVTWTGDWRWGVTGAFLFCVGVVLAWVLIHLQLRQRDEAARRDSELTSRH